MEGSGEGCSCKEMKVGTGKEEGGACREGRVDVERSMSPWMMRERRTLPGRI